MGQRILRVGSGCAGSGRGHSAFFYHGCGAGIGKTREAGKKDVRKTMEGVFTLGEYGVAAVAVGVQAAADMGDSPQLGGGI